MESPRKERAIVDIKATLSKHSEIVENLLPARAISGCDTVASYYGLGKGSVIKVLKAGAELSSPVVEQGKVGNKNMITVEWKSELLSFSI
ncbi:hypothetical protein NQZ68_039057 [Dissostichus eleginoides]|nr:hypothetical protein NQZ68_039057 [Dissostichus eleginoides]